MENKNSYGVISAQTAVMNTNVASPPLLYEDQTKPYADHDQAPSMDRLCLCLFSQVRRVSLTPWTPASMPTPLPHHQGFEVGSAFFLMGQVSQAKVFSEAGDVFVINSFRDGHFLTSAYPLNVTKVLRVASHARPHLFISYTLGHFHHTFPILNFWYINFIIYIPVNSRS